MGRGTRLISGIAIAIAATCSPVPGHTATWADPAKTLRVVMEVDVTGFDPAATQDLYSGTIEARIFDALYVWDYLARPYRLVPSIAAAMPQISADGRTWTIRIRPGIYFTADPAFGGKKRELTARDFVYSWERLVDPRVHSPWVDLLESKLAGLDAAIAKARTTGRFDYDAEIEGLKAIDRYTLQFTLVDPDYTFLPYLASFVGLRAVAREVIEKYGDASGRAMDHPVGTGPYRMKEWRHGQKVTLEANRDYREEYFPDAPANADAATKAMAAAMKGKRIPQIGTIDIAIIEESNPRLLAFDRGDLDLLDVRYDLALKVVDEAGRLRSGYASRGVQLGRETELSLSYSYFNMEDLVVGGYAPEKVALRRAICTAYNVEEEIRVIRQGQGERATQPIPPDVPGYVPGRKPTPYDPSLAKALLDRFGYKGRDGHGYRELPDGRPLVLHIASEPDQTSRLFDELWQRNLQAIGIKVEFHKQKWPDLFKAAHAGQLQFWELGLTGGIADYYMQQFYGPSAGAANLARFKNADFDALFRQSRRVADPEERTNIYAKMIDIVSAYNPWCPKAFRIANTVVAPWVFGYKKNVYYLIHPWHYLDVNPARQRP
jgi:ABC-type transport system substrate-binding protein